SLGRLAEEAALHGYRQAYLTDPHQGRSLYTEKGLYQKSLLVIGSEAHGAGPLPGAATVTIPMPGNSESLNVAQAATIFIFEYVRRTRKQESAPNKT
ncbi:MAG: TrmH family RNA methyltransferase, partial [Victivallales bacterium]|nr:TrmH family RNA methyltransferase [Victivallales bacterium]